MFGFLYRMLFFCFLFLIGIALYFWYQKEAFLEEYLSDQLGQKVEIEKLTFRPDRITLYHFVLANPSKGQNKKSLTIEQINCNFSLFQIFQKKKTISSLVLIQPHFYLEFYNHSGIKNNWSKILQDRSPTTQTTFTIQRLIVKHASFDITRQKNRSPSHYTAPDFSLLLTSTQDIFLTLSYEMLFPLTEHLSCQEILQDFPHSHSQVPKSYLASKWQALKNLGKKSL